MNLFVASRCGRTHIVEKILKSYISAVDRVRNIRLRDDENENTALILAAREGHTDIVEILLTNDPDPQHIRLTDAAGNTALMMAASNEYTEIVEKLLTRDSAIQHIRLQNNNGDTALIMAVRKGHKAMVERLLANDPDPLHIRLQDNNGDTALMWAAIRGHEAIVEILLTRDSAIQHIRLQDNNGQTALMWAATRYEYSEIVEKLLIRDSDSQHIQLRDDEEIIEIEYTGDTALIIAWKWHNLETVEKLLSYGAILSLEDRQNFPELARLARQYSQQERQRQANIASVLHPILGIGGSLQASPLSLILQYTSNYMHTPYIPDFRTTRTRQSFF